MASGPVYIDVSSKANPIQIGQINSIINSSYKDFLTATAQVQSGETEVKQIVDRNTLSALIAGFLDLSYLRYCTISFTLRTDITWNKDPDGNYLPRELFTFKSGIDFKQDVLGIGFDDVAFLGVNSNTAITEILNNYFTMKIIWKSSAQAYALYLYPTKEPPKTTWGVYIQHQFEVA